MSVKTLERKAFQVVGLQIRTKPHSPEIPALWPRFVARIPEIGHQSEPRVAYGVMQPPADEPSALDYMAGVAVSDAGRIPDGMTAIAVPAGTYAVFAYPLSGLGQGFGEIFGRLMPQSGLVQVPGPLLERYDESFDPNDPGSRVEIYLPVRRR